MHNIVRSRTWDINFWTYRVLLLTESVTIILYENVLQLLFFAVLVQRGLLRNLFLLSNDWCYYVFKFFVVILRSRTLFHAWCFLRPCFSFRLLFYDVKAWPRHFTFVGSTPYSLSFLISKVGWWFFSLLLTIFCIQIVTFVKISLSSIYWL